MANPLEIGRDPLLLQDIDPLYFLPLELRSRIGPDWQEVALNALSHAGVTDGEEPIEFENPLKRHDGSGALYFWDGMALGRDRVYGSILVPGVRTTRHMHGPQVTEEYRVLRGSMNIKVDDQIHKITPPSGLFKVYSGQVHEAWTEDNEFAHVFIVIRGGAAKSKDELHLRPDSSR